MKKTIKFVGIIFLAFVLLSSCIVSKKKYDTLQADRLKLSDKYDSLYIRFRSLAAKHDSLSAKNKDLEKKKKELLELNQTELQRLNAELQQKIDSLEKSKAIITELQAAIEKQKQASQLLLAKIKAALTSFTSDELTVEMRDGKIYVSLSEKLLFKSGSATVDKKGIQALAKVGEVLSKQTDIDIVVEGHTDNVPLKGEVIKDNWDLSVMRATAIARILTNDYGVDPKQVIPSGRADKFPIAENTTPEGRAKNRRTEIILAPKISELMKIIENK